MTELLTAEEVDRRLGDRLPNWRRHDGHLVFVAEAASHDDAIAVVSAAVEVLQASSHDTNFIVELIDERVVLSLHTPSQGGISDADLALAEAIGGGPQLPDSRRPPISPMGRGDGPGRADLLGGAETTPGGGPMPGDLYRS